MSERSSDPFGYTWPVPCEQAPWCDEQPYGRQTVKPVMPAPERRAATVDLIEHLIRPWRHRKPTTDEELIVRTMIRDLRELEDGK